MFKKPISNIKQYSLLRASDRRKLKDKLISSFQTLEAFEQKNKDVENKDDVSAIILPEQIQSVKITTHSGINGVLYVTQEKHPIWLTLDIDKEEILVPTVYTLWKFPDILPKIPTFRIVVDKLVGGANLMIPGIAYPPEKLPNVKIDEIVAITIQGHNYPVGIGIMKVETSSLERGSKKKGLAVQIIHMYKDYLWDMGDKSLPSDSNDQVAAEYDEYDAAIDEILQASLYQALLEKLTPKETLPISGSKLYDSYLLPCRPIGTEDTVDIKKSSHKNLTKFLKAIEKKGVIKLRARKGEILLDSVNWEHDELTTFRSHKSIEKSSNITTTGSNSEIQKIQIVEVFKPRDAVCDLFENQNKSKDNVYEYKELKNVVSGYVKTKNLSDRENRKFIILDELLRSIFAEKTGVAAPDKLTYNDLVYNIGEKMEKFHLLTFPNQETKLLKGTPHKVELIQSKLMGNKVVTSVRGLEKYEINLNELVGPLKKLCASSVTVDKISSSSPKNPLYEIIAQGPQIKIIMKYLIETKGIPERYIETKGYKSKEDKKKQ
nr:14555_t:CDS:2 [Entrophospora candida]